MLEILSKSNSYKEKREEKAFPGIKETPQATQGAVKSITERTRGSLELVRSHPLSVAQRKAIELYSGLPIKLRKNVYYGGIHWKRGDAGFVLSRNSLDILPSSAKELLMQQLEKFDVELCSLGEWIYTLPKDYFTIDKKNIEKTLTFDF